MMTMAALNDIIHQPVRLRIMAVLAGLPTGMQLTFNYLKDALDLTDGNLSVHLHRLEEASYVAITKTFVHNKPQTYVESTAAGRQAFEEHIAALSEILESSQRLGKHGPDAPRGHTS
jgi:DNA-binding MarR family transcriptional regulator